jgi:succinyl-diaminopimelate desuccinylase
LILILIDTKRTKLPLSKDYVEYERYIVIGRVGKGRPVVQFNGHYDVVPPGQGWRKDPFRPWREGDRLYGRGSVDMKGGLASALLAVKSFLESNEASQGTIEIAFVPDEEIGGEAGTGYLVETGLSRPDYVLIPEPSGSGSVWIGHKGNLWAYIWVKGRQAHASSPWLGVNAFEYMVKVADLFMEMYVPLLERKVSGYEYDDPRGARPTVTIGGEVRGGAKINIVPGYYEFSVDRRTIVEENLDEVEEELSKVVTDIRNRLGNAVEIGYRVVSKSPPAFTDPNGPLVRAVVSSAEEVLKVRPRTVVCLGGLDMHYYTSKGIETVAYGPGPSENAHKVDEYVSIREIKDVAKVFFRTLEKLID